MSNPFVPIIMGSESDLDHAKKIAAGLDSWKIGHDYRIASAHRHPEYVLRIIEEYDKNSELSVVYIAVAGRPGKCSLSCSEDFRYKQQRA